MTGKQLAWVVFSRVCGSNRCPNILHPNWLFTREYLRVLLDQRGFVRGNVLDVGSGDRYFEQVFRGQYVRYVGLDYPETRQGFSDVEHLPPPDVAGDGRHLPFAGQTFDTVLLFEVLEHCAEPADMLAEIYAVLKPGGILLMTAPFTIQEHSQPYDYFRYTSFGLRYLLGEANFRVGALVPIGNLGTVLARYVNRALIEGTFSRGTTVGRWFKLLVTPLVLLVWLAHNLGGMLLNQILPQEGVALGHCVVAKKGRDAVEG